MYRDVFGRKVTGISDRVETGRGQNNRKINHSTREVHLKSTLGRSLTTDRT